MPNCLAALDVTKMSLYGDKNDTLLFGCDSCYGVVKQKHLDLFCSPFCIYYLCIVIFIELVILCKTR